MERCDIVVVGAGAAGLMAARSAAMRGARVRLLDSQTKIGAKILVAGGGRCNVTNDQVDAGRFHGGSRTFIARVLRAFNQAETLRFFAETGVPLKLEETGKYFPVSDSARTVLNALLGAVTAAGAELITEQPVREITRREQGWRIRTPQLDLECAAVIVCTGGLALPKSGSDGAGYRFAGQFGHTLVPTTPALSPLLANPAAHAGLSGITLPVRLALRHGKAPLAAYRGSFLFTHHGYSGPVALNLSRHVARDRWTQPEATVYLRLLPDVSEGAEGVFWQGFVHRNARKSMANALGELLPQRVAAMVLQEAGVPPALAAGRLSPRQQQSVREALLDQALPVQQVAGYTKAEATAGGIDLEEIDPATMMSRLAPGLFFAGEVMDVDGWLGGYNFQWAWSSGTVAGRAAARYALRLEK